MHVAERIGQRRDVRSRREVASPAAEPTATPKAIADREIRTSTKTIDVRLGRAVKRQRTHTEGHTITVGLHISVKRSACVCPHEQPVNRRETATHIAVLTLTQHTLGRGYLSSSR